MIENDTGGELCEMAVLCIIRIILYYVLYYIMYCSTLALSRLPRALVITGIQHREDSS